MSNGVLTMDEEGLVVTCNAAGQRILQLTAADVLKKPSTEVFKDENAWVIDRIKRNEEDGEIDVMMDAELKIGGETLSTNLTFQPLVGYIVGSGAWEVEESVAQRPRNGLTLDCSNC